MHGATAHSLNPVVPDCGRRAQAFFYVSLLEDVTVRRRIGPHSGVTVRLQLESDGKLVPQIRPPLLRLPHLLLGAQQPLDVMADLVRQHVRLGKVARSPEAPAQLVVEPEIDVDLLVARTVERSGRRLGESAGRSYRVAKQDQLRMSV